MSVQVFSTAAGSFILNCWSNQTKPWELKLICQNPFIVLFYRSYCVLACCPTKVRDAVGEYILLFSITTTANGGGGGAVVAALRRRRQPEAAAAPCMASYIAVHRKTLCSPIFVFFSSHIIIFRWQALQFGFVPSQPSCQSRILYATNTTNQPFA